MGFLVQAAHTGLGFDSRAVTHSVASDESRGLRNVRGRGPVTILLAVLAAFLLPSLGAAEDDPNAQAPGAAPPPPDDVEEIVVTETREGRLDRISGTGSRLGLDDLETPATLDRVSQAKMLELGLDSVVSAYNAAPGITAGDLPALPGEAAVRGFVGGSAISYLLDGVHLTNSALMSRNWDSWNFEQIEILKGPGSVLHGEGALAGSINLVPKKPRIGESGSELLLSGGSFGMTRLGAGTNLPLGDHVALRGDISWKRSDGFIDDSDSETQAITTGLLLAPTESLTVSVALEYFSDDFGTAYWGTPLVAASRARDPSGIASSADGLVVDKAARDENYNVNDGVMESKSYWLRSRAQYEINENWQLSNELSYFNADRKWMNSEDYIYNFDSGLLDRSATIITHDQQVWLERLILGFDGELGGVRTRFSLGGEYSETNFFSNRRFGNTTSVDHLAPERGVFPDVSPENFSSRSDFDSDADSAAAFAELAIDASDRLTLVTGVRHDRIRLSRGVDDLNEGTESKFRQEFRPISWRAGAVYDILDKTQLYAQYSHAVAPVSSLLLINQARAEFDLTTGNSFELGVKSTFWQDRVSLTASLYRIRQEDILTRDPANSALSVQGGRQSSKGIELSLTAQLTDSLRIDANGAVLDSSFDDLLEAGGANRAGNRPRNVPEQVFNLSAQYQLSMLPVALGVSMQHAGDFFTNNANTIEVDGHTIFGASLTWKTEYGDVILRAKNLTDEFYAEWSGFSSTHVYLGAPRRLELVYSTQLF